MKRSRLEWTLGGVAAWLATGTALNVTRSPHWYPRGWDFPRLLTLGMAVGTATAWRRFLWKGRPVDYAVAGSMAAVAGWQVMKIGRYLPVAPRPVKRARRVAPEDRLRVVVSNVLQCNEQYARWLRVVRAQDPDVIVALEPDEAWAEALRPLHFAYPYRVSEPRDNCYGMIVLSRLPLHDTEIKHLVQDDIPSIHTRIELRNGEEVWLHALHPRPPEPLRNQDSAPRDSELVHMAREIEKAPDLPRIVCGDLNDVAWSYSTRLFLRVSGLLDPREGRGLFNTFNANYPHPFRWPLDHVFHSGHFRLIGLRVLPHVGSDHFPVRIDLAWAPPPGQVEETEEPSDRDRDEAQEVIDRQPPRERPPVA